MRALTHLSLFSGLGGLDLAAERAGFTTVGQCEFADFPRKVLEKHWPDVPRWRDVRDLTRDSFKERTGLGAVDVVSGGFPCQPFSVAGRQRGELDERYLWPEMLRIIADIRPLWVVAENVPGILRIAADAVCEGLEREGYAVRTYVYEAAAVGAPHRRSRVAFVAHCNSVRGMAGQRAIVPTEAREHAQRHAAGRCEAVADADSTGCEEHDAAAKPSGQGYNPWRATETLGDAECRGQHRQPWWRARQKPEDGCQEPCGGGAEPGLGGVPDGLAARLDGYRWPAPLGQAQYDWEPPRTAHGISHRAERVRALGNMVVPQWAYPIFKAIAAIERGWL